MATVAKSKGKAKSGVIEGYLMYVQIVKPRAVFAEKDSPNPQNTEYQLDVIVSEDQADEWNEQFKKQEASVIKASDFETAFKVPVPERYKGEKKLYRIRLKKSAKKNGEEFNPEYRPRAFLDTNEKDEEGNTIREEITTTRLIANGSYGKVSYSIQNNTYGDFAYLKNILLKEEGFIEYEPSGGEAGDEFGGNVKTKREAKKEEAPSKPAASKGKTTKATEEVDVPWDEEAEQEDDPF